MNRRIVIVGGGHGVAAVLHALRDDGLGLTAIVTIGDDGGSSGELRRRWGGPAVGDVRRSLIALSGEESAVGRAFARPVTIHRLGTHPFGNLVLRSLTGAFGDLETATEWLEQHLRIDARVLPATVEPITLLADNGAERPIRGESAIGRTPPPIRRLRFEPAHPASPRAALDAIAAADWVLLAPGSLFTSTLAAAALPDVTAALADAAAPILWLCNLQPEPIETARMSASDHLAALRLHGVRVDAVLYDPDAALHFTAAELARDHLLGFPRRLRAQQPGRHDPRLLRAVLTALFDARVPLLHAAPPVHTDAHP